MKTLTLIAALILTTQAFAIETNDVDCPALNESSLEKGAQDGDAQQGDANGASQE